MTTDPTRLALAFDVFLLSVVLAWPAGHPLVAVGVLAGYGVLLLSAVLLTSGDRRQPGR